MTAKDFFKERNGVIYRMFTVKKLRQKEIAKRMELSESQVKHIIGSVKKQLAIVSEVK